MKGARFDYGSITESIRGSEGFFLHQFEEDDGILLLRFILFIFCLCAVKKKKTSFDEFLTFTCKTFVKSVCCCCSVAC